MASFLKDVGKQLKSNMREGAVKGISKSVFGKGIVGGALGKAFEKKFSAKEEKDDRVSDALQEQVTKEDQINATLAHMESIVLNIADNIYNIAGVLNAQVTSMKEAKRIQQERLSREAANAEENSSESTSQIAAPSAAGTEGTEPKKGGIMGMLSGLTGSVKNLKGMFGKFGKKFAIVAAGLAATGALAYGLSGSDTGDTEGEPTPVPSETPEPPTASGVSYPSGVMGGATLPEPTKVEQPPAASPASMMTNAIATQGGERGKAEAPHVANIMGAMQSGDMGSMIGAVQEHQKAFPQPAAAPEPTRAAPPPKPSAITAAPSGGSSDAEGEMKQVSAWLDDPANAADKQNLAELTDLQTRLKYGLSQAKQSLAGARPESKKKYEDIVKQMEDDIGLVKAQRRAILNKARKQLGFKGEIQEGGAIVDTSQASPPSAMSATPSASGGGGSSGGGGAAPVPSAPSSGASVGSASTSVAAASELPPPKNNNISMSTDAPPTGTPAESIMPSPVADRGSLDIRTTFGSGS